MNLLASSAVCQGSLVVKKVIACPSGTSGTAAIYYFHRHLDLASSRIYDAYAAKVLSLANYLLSRVCCCIQFHSRGAGNLKHPQDGARPHGRPDLAVGLSRVSRTLSGQLERR